MLYKNYVSDCRKGVLDCQKHMLAIVNIRLTFYVVIFAIQNAFLGQCRTPFVYQTNCSQLPLIRCDKTHFSYTDFVHVLDILYKVAVELLNTVNS